MTNFSKFPKFITTSHKSIKILKLHFLLVPTYFLQNTHKLSLLQLMLLSIQYFLYMLILLQQILITVLATINFIIN
jgi:hypothetical protein